MIAEYVEAFNRCYPHHHVKVKPVRKHRDPEVQYRVFINGDGGEHTLTADDIKSATRMFNRGRKH